MTITSAVCNTFKTEVLKAVHNFTNGGNTFRLALYTSSATLNKSTTAYSTSNEISNTSGSAYVAGGKALTSVTPAASSTTAVCDFSDVSYTDATFTANGCLIYNDSASGDPACVAVAFGADKTVTSGTFTVQFPAQTAGNAIVQIA